MPTPTTTPTMGNLVHNVDIRKPFAHTPYTAIGPVQLKPGLICEEHTSPAYQWPLKVRIFPRKPVTMPNCTHFKTLVRTRLQMSFPEMVSEVCAEIFSCAIHQFHQLSGWMVSDDPPDEEAGCGGPKILEKYIFWCIWNISGIFYFSSCNMGPTLYMLCFYFCSVYKKTSSITALNVSPLVTAGL